MSRIVFGSANHWTSPYQVGSHAWARLFAGHGWKVAYVSDPVTPWHWISRKDWERTRERLALWRTGITSAGGGQVWAWSPCSLVSPRNTFLFRSAWVLRHWDRFSFPSTYKQLITREFDKPDILWLDSIRHAGWGKLLKPKRTILRVADWQAGMESTPPSALPVEQELVFESDLVIAASEVLAQRLGSLRKGKPLLTIRNGVDAAFWQEPVPLPAEYAIIKPPRAVYVGALDRWFDIHLLTAVAQALPNIQFVLIGQRRFELTAATPGNVHWLGTRPREQARGYLQHAQAGLIPFRRTELIECVCPLKLYEYTACGLPVVATRWAELERMKSPAFLATGVDEWITCLKTALTPGACTPPQLRQYAEENSWEKRWQTIYPSLTP